MHTKLSKQINHFDLDELDHQVMKKFDLRGGWHEHAIKGKSGCRPRWHKMIMMSIINMTRVDAESIIKEKTQYSHRLKERWNWVRSWGLLIESFVAKSLQSHLCAEKFHKTILKQTTFSDGNDGLIRLP